jgi:hypothetical protein
VRHRPNERLRGLGSAVPQPLLRQREPHPRQKFGSEHHFSALFVGEIPLHQRKTIVKVHHRSNATEQEIIKRYERYNATGCW